MNSRLSLIPKTLCLITALSGCASTPQSNSSSGPAVSSSPKGVSQESTIAISSVRFPLQIDTIPWANISNYAQTGGPGGIGASYRNDDIKLDIYLYTAGDKEWTNYPVDQRLSLDVLTFEATLKEMEKKGVYSKFQFRDLENTVVHGYTFAHIPFSFVEKGGQRKSHYYISAYGDKLLKVRLTAFKEVTDDELSILFSKSIESFVSLNIPAPAI